MFYLLKYQHIKWDDLVSIACQSRFSRPILTIGTPNKTPRLCKRDLCRWNSVSVSPEMGNLKEMGGQWISDDTQIRLRNDNDVRKVV